MISSFKMSALANGWLQTYWKLLGIIFVAFALRVAVRCYSGSADFWINGYTSDREVLRTAVNLQL
jgi:hypothetical protein